MKGKLPAICLFYFLIVAVFIGLTIGGSEVVSTMTENQPVQRKHIVIIDPGHGGIDGGATSCTGILESEINLSIGLRLNDLMHLIGYETQMIRTTDTSVYTEGNTIAQQKISDLKERVRVVNETTNGVLISIHQNTFSDGRYSGAQVFYSDMPESRKLAESLQSAVIRTLNPSSNRKPKKADGIYLLERVERTAVLVECGFLSNPEEEAKLRSVGYQQKLCCVIAAVMGEYLSSLAG